MTTITIRTIGTIGTAVIPVGVIPAAAVELLGGNAGLVAVEEGRMRFYADESTCGCGTHEERDGLACAHMRAVGDAFEDNLETAA